MDWVKKLQYRDADALLLVNVPEDMRKHFQDAFPDIEIVEAGNEAAEASFIVSFVRSEEDIQHLSEKMGTAGLVEPLFWVAYPKKSSPRYRVAISRDRGWNSLKEAGWKPVRQVSLDDDWSAIRFRFAR